MSSFLHQARKMAQVVERISARELAVILKDPAKRNEIRIVDVRDDDFRGGHIRGAINLPEDNFQDDDDVDNIVEEFKNVPTVVFHCMMSQVRGPFCAKRFQSRVDVVLEGAETKPQVRILTGGFNLFGRVRTQD
ncbi:hypothetical protein LEN26_002866 [Aphanomyces euteiches]|nr:hypothetical protein AeMF1_007185 [Aphanomyces euteiches]KAH9154978.1 hypothetical protein AeRB84_003017 [Aphanomyces euteiches]KAH9158585.1 hypothetical protein LEN26_002866 [Aphanomyces euteiches]KAH9183991.1 hypothetical protein AeNC1_014032 [Aphanomyces euteiches]